MYQSAKHAKGSVQINCIQNKFLIKINYNTHKMITYETWNQIYFYVSFYAHQVLKPMRVNGTRELKPNGTEILTKITTFFDFVMLTYFHSKTSILSSLWPSCIKKLQSIHNLPKMMVSCTMGVIFFFIWFLFNSSFFWSFNLSVSKTMRLWSPPQNRFWDS